MNNFEKVKYFNQTFGILTNDVYDANIFTNKWGVVKYRLDLINEEINELIDGCKKNDFLEVLDSICDILYVTYGKAITLGINLESEFKQRFIKSDKTNFELVKELLASQDDGSQFTGKLEESYIGAIREIAEQMKETFNKLEYTCKHSQNESVEATQKIITDLLLDITHSCYHIGCLIKIDVDYAFNLVHEANMTKACKTEQEAMETVEKYLQEKENFIGDEEYPYQFPSYKLSSDGKYFIIFNDDKRENPKFAGKILKSKNWQEPNFSEFKV